jgi:hypothetical protein
MTAVESVGTSPRAALLALLSAAPVSPSAHPRGFVAAEMPELLDYYDQHWQEIHDRLVTWGIWRVVD